MTFWSSDPGCFVDFGVPIQVVLWIHTLQIILDQSQILGSGTRLISSHLSEWWNPMVVDVTGDQAIRLHLPNVRGLPFPLKEITLQLPYSSPIQGGGLADCLQWHIQRVPQGGYTIHGRNQHHS